MKMLDPKHDCKMMKWERDNQSRRLIMDQKEYDRGHKDGKTDRPWNNYNPPKCLNTFTDGKKLDSYNAGFSKSSRL
jgi:hypothetical protein